MSQNVYDTYINSLHIYTLWLRVSWKKEWQPIPIFLPWEFPWTEELAGLQSRRSQRVRHDWNNLAHTYDLGFIVAHILDRRKLRY